MLLYICTKFRKKIFKDFKVLRKVEMISILKFTKGHISLKTVGKVMALTALHQILETFVTFHFPSGKVYSLNKGCHT